MTSFTPSTRLPQEQAMMKLRFGSRSIPER